MQFNHPMRAVVLDDKPDEAIGLMKAFSRMGIPAAHYHPDELEKLDEDESRRPVGVRLLGLDLDLIGKGTTDIKMAVGSITRLIHPIQKNGPYGLIVWSNHPDEDASIVQSLDTYCCDHMPIFKIYFSKSLAQSAPEQLEAEIVAELEKDSALCDLLFWESQADRAASDAVMAIANLGKGKELADILTALARGAVGKDCVLPEQRLRGVSEALAQIHFDIMEQLPVSATPAEVKSKDDLSDIARAELNSRLLTGTAWNKTSPGSVYLVDDWNWHSCPFPRTDELYDRWKNDFSKCLSKYGDSPGKPILLEVTASCDYAQGKSYGQHFVTGLLLPSTTSVNGQFLRSVGPILHDKKPCKLVFNSRVLLWASVDEDSMPTPILRLRHAPLEDIRTWLAGMSARGGVISV